MMKCMTGIVILSAFFLLYGCAAAVPEIPPEQIPIQYDDGSYSVKGFLAEQPEYPVRIRGFIDFRYECPPLS